MVAADGTPLDASEKKAAFEQLAPQYRRRRGVFIQGQSLCLADVASVAATEAGMTATLKAVNDPALVGTIGATGSGYAETPARSVSGGR